MGFTDGCQGCSTGGRQGHMMAQRYPTQYNGVLATASAFNWDKFVTSEYWPQVVMHKLGKIIASLLEACHANLFQTIILLSASSTPSLRLQLKLVTN